MTLQQARPQAVVERDTDELMTLILRPAKWMSAVNFNFTNRCNVRCVYCPQGSHAEGFHADSARGLIDHIKSYIIDNGVPRAGVGFYGETLLIKGWESD